jgi:hypothetical protein
MLADPPDLSRLALRNAPAPIDATLLELLAKQQGGRKKECDNHEYPVGDVPNNCAANGYLMVKETIAYTSGSGLRSAVEAPNQEYAYLIDDALGKPCKVRALRREDGLHKRRQTLEDRHEQYLNAKENFKRRCAQFFNPTKDAAGKDIVQTFGLEYRNNIADIAKYTDFYYIDHDEPDKRPDKPQQAYFAAVAASQRADNPKSKSMLHMATDRGFIFLSVMDTPARKRELDMPHQGVYAEPYVYVVIACAAGYPGYGSVLLDLAERLAAQIGVQRMALAALPNACGAYYARGYRFAPWSGNVIELPEKFFRVNDKGKRILLWDENVDSELEGELRAATSARKRKEPEGARDAAPGMRTRSQNAKRPQKISSVGTDDAQTARLPEWLFSTA